MSDRQARNRRKARRRKVKLLAEAATLPAPDGWSLHFEERDFGHILEAAIRRESDGVRLGIWMAADRLWRRMDYAPRMLADRLAEAMEPSADPWDRIAWDILNGMAITPP